MKFNDSKKGRSIELSLSQFLNRGLLHDVEMGRFPLCKTEMIQRQPLHWVTGPFLRSSCTISEQQYCIGLLKCNSYDQISKPLITSSALTMQVQAKIEQMKSTTLKTVTISLLKTTVSS